MATVNPNDNDPLERLPIWLIYVAALIIAVHIFCFCLLTDQPGSRIEKNPLAEWGQIGDALGSLNSLLTGLALVGLIYTAVLQRRQALSQSKQLTMQQDELNENRLALRRQSREQFLTARLQAETAILHVESEIWRQHAVEGNKFETSERSRAMDRRRIAIQLLRLESQQGFDTATWTLSTQKETIRRLLVEWSQRYLSLYERLLPSIGAPYARGLMISATTTMKSEIDVLLEDYAPDHPGLQRAVKPLLDALEKYEANPQSALGELLNALCNYLQKGSGFWADDDGLAWLRASQPVT